MTSDRTDESSQTEWLPTVQMPWSAPDGGQWWITAHWAKVGGRATIVGIDVRSFHAARADGADAPEPIGAALAEVTQRTLRGVSISQLRDAGKDTLRLVLEVAEGLREVADATDRWTVVGGEPSELLSTLTAKGTPRKRRPPATEDLLRRVAALYEQATAQGDRAPSKYVEEQLRDAGEPRLSTSGGGVLVRQWVRRARERGYLTIPPGGS